MEKEENSLEDQIEKRQKLYETMKELGRQISTELGAYLRFF